jgi:hypothetical protein
MPNYSTTYKLIINRLFEAGQVIKIVLNLVIIFIKKFFHFSYNRKFFVQLFQSLLFLKRLLFLVIDYLQTAVMCFG